jgi:hypothetical protein
MSEIEISLEDGVVDRCIAFARRTQDVFAAPANQGVGPSENDLAAMCRSGIGEQMPGYIPMRRELEHLATFWAEWFVTTEEENKICAGMSDHCSLLYAKRHLNMLADVIGEEIVEAALKEARANWAARHPESGPTNG